MNSKTNIIDIYPLSPVQKGILFNCINENTDKDLYNIKTLLSIDGNFNLKAFEAALIQLFNNNACLRIGFFWEDGAFPVQFIANKIENFFFLF